MNAAGGGARFDFELHVPEVVVCNSDSCEYLQRDRKGAHCRLNQWPKLGKILCQSSG